MIFVVQSTTDESVTFGEFESGADAAAESRRLNGQWQEEGSGKRTRVVRREKPAEVEDAVWIYGRASLPSGMYSCAAHPYQGRTPAGYRVEQIPASGFDWRKREMQRPLRSELPWQNEAWWQTSDYWPLHFPYPARKDASKIAFTASEEHGREDRQTVMRPGAYLKRYFQDLADDAVQRWALDWATTFAPVGLSFATTADEIQDVYEHGPDSCMGYDAGTFMGGVHPVRAYAGPDLELAYIRNADGDISGRAIVWPEKMIHTVVYGDIERMQDALGRAGYARAKVQQFEGARLARIEAEGGRFHVPYLDYGSNLTDDGRYLVIDSGGEIEGDSTSGVSAGARCYYCGEAIDPDDALCDPTGNGEMYCEDCYSECFGYCEDCSEDYPREETACGPDNRHRCETCHEHAVGECWECGEDVMQDELVEGPDGKDRCEDCHCEAVAMCDECLCDVMREDMTGDVCSDCAEDAPEDAPPARRTPHAPMPDSRDTCQIAMNALNARGAA